MKHTPQLALTQPRRPVFQIATVGNYRQRDTHCGILYSRYLDWLRSAKPSAILGAYGTAATLLLLLLAYLFPYYLLGLLVGALTWNGYKIPAYLASCVLLLNARRIWRWTVSVVAWGRREDEKDEAAVNQHTFLGVPYDALIDFLMEEGAFKFVPAKKALGISDRKYAKIADVLERNRVLVRDVHQGNARVLAEISRAELSRQVREDFPLVWDDVSKAWIEKDDAYGRYLRDRDHKEKKQAERTERKQRKVERLEKKIEEKKQELAQVAEQASPELQAAIGSAFAQAMAFAGADPE